MQTSRWATPAAAPPPAAEPFTHSEGAVSDMSYPPPPDPLEEDAFAQTRGADDLFDDDYTPILQTTTTQEVIEQENVESQDHAPRDAPRGPRGRGKGRGARRGRGGGAAAAAAVSPAMIENAGTEQSPRSSDGENGQVAVEEGAKKDAAVRGDRSGTGGVKQERLTDEALNAKLAAMKLKNAALTAAYERSLKDEAAFQDRESQAKVLAAAKAKAERQNRQVMMGERERNRMRKLNAQGGREWDSEKRQEDLIGNERGGRARRGAHGAVVDSPSRYAVNSGEKRAMGYGREGSSPSSPYGSSGCKVPSPPTLLGSGGRKGSAPSSPSRGHTRKGSSPTTMARNGGRRGSAPPSPARGGSRPTSSTSSPSRKGGRKASSPLSPSRGQGRTGSSPPSAMRGANTERRQVRGGKVNDRGGRGRGGERGGKGRGNSMNAESTARQRLPTTADFPDLPVSNTPRRSSDDKVKPAPQLTFPLSKKKSPPQSPSAASKQSNPSTSPKAQATTLKTSPKTSIAASFGLSPLLPGKDKRSWADEVENPTSPT